MKLALLAARLPPANDGVGDHADRLAQALAAGGHDVTAIGAGEVRPARDYAIELTGARWGPVATSRALALLRDRQFDALIVEYTPFLYGARSLAPPALLGAARALGVRSAAIVHEAFHPAGSPAVRSEWKARLLGGRDALTLSLAGTLAVPGATRAEQIGARLPALRDRIAIVPIGANVEPPPGTVWQPHAPATIVAFGVVMPRRRLEHAIDALAALTAGGAELRLDVIGRIYDRAYAAALLERAAARGIAGRVRLRGEMAAGAISAALCSAAAAVHAAHEGSIASSGSLLALLAHGVPTVALRTRHDDPIFGGAVHYADDGRGLAAGLAALCEHPLAARGLSAAARSRYRAHFAWTTVAERLLSAMHEEAVDARLATA